MITRILGIDPGSVKTGWGFLAVDGMEIVEWASGVICPPAKDSMPVRLAYIFDEVEKGIKFRKPDVMVYEDGYVGSNSRTSLVIGMARAIPAIIASRAGIPVVNYAPASIKKIVGGHGAATKKMIQTAVTACLETKAKFGEDEADALAVALTHRQAIYVQTF